MDELTACRICLATDVKLVKFCQYQLIQTYELLIGAQCLPDDGLSHWLCSICHRILQKCAAFQYKCCTSYNILSQAVRERPITTAYVRSLDRNLYNLNHPYETCKSHMMTIKDEDVQDDNVVNYIELDESFIKNESNITIIDNVNIVNTIFNDIFHDSLNDTNYFSSDEEPLSKIKGNYTNDVIMNENNKRTKKKTSNKSYLRKKKKHDCQNEKIISKQSVNNENTVNLVETIGNLTNEQNDISNVESVNDIHNGSSNYESLNDIHDESLKNIDNELSCPMKRVKKKLGYNTNEDLTYLMENDIDIIYLSKEEQKQQIECRKMSNNFVMSQFKCHLCYKGYMTDVTYENHMTIHDPSRGAHVCDICQSTFSSARNLASHAANSHSRDFVCKQCNTVFKSCHKAKEHIKWHQGVTFDCHICGASFRKRTTYMTHTRVRHRSGVVCEECGERFRGAYGLNMHVKKSHRGLKMSKSTAARCDHCNVTFKSSEALERHKLLANGDICDSQLQPCHVCGESFPCQSSLEQHLDSHKTTKRYDCDQCKKSYTSMGSYSTHWQRQHTTTAVARAFVCEHCGVRCSNKYVLKNHIRSHTGEKPYQCKLCPKRFTLPQRLQIHVRTHTGERPFQCASCPKAFTHKAGLNRHTAVHTGAKPYTCAHCQKSFSQSNSLKIHIRTVHLKQPAPYRRNNKGKESEFQSNPI